MFRTLLGAVFLMALCLGAMPGSLNAADAQFAVQFASVDDSDGSATYAIESKQGTQEFAEVVRQAPTKTGDTAAPLQITYRTNANFGLYTIRIRMVSPAESPFSNEASVQVDPGKPTIIKFGSTRSTQPAVIQPVTTFESPGTLAPATALVVPPQTVKVASVTVPSTGKGKQRK